MIIEAKVGSKKGKTVTLLNRHVRATKQGTTVQYLVRNGEDKLYSVWLYADGLYDCRGAEDQQTCMALQHGRKCYHVATCEEVEKPLTFGKHQGKKMAELPLSYIRWLSSHASKLTSEHRHVSMLAKSWQIAAPVVADELVAVEALSEPVVVEVAEEATPVAPPEATRLPIARSTWKPLRPKEDARGDLYYRPFSLLK